MADGMEHYSTKVKSRKLVGNCDELGRNVRKRKRNIGHEYGSGKPMSVKMYTDKDCKCGLRCMERLGDENDRAYVHDTFWSMGNFDEQNTHLAGMVHIMNIKRRRGSTDAEDSHKQHSRVYYVNFKGDTNIRVCKTMFLNLHGISNGRLSRILSKQDASDTRQNVDFQQQSKKQQKQQQQQFSDVPDTETDPVEASDSDGFVQDDTCDTRQSVDLQQQREQQQQFADVTDNEADRVDTGNSDGFVHDIGATYIPSANAEQQCYLKWKFHQNNQQAMLSKLLKKESFCDVTIACEEKIIRAHKLMLSASSSYFEMILSRYEDQNPIIILKDVRYDDMSALLQFIYKGEVNIEESQLSSLLETADMLKVKGLSEICRETRRVETPLQAVDIKTEEEEDDASSTFEPAKTMQETKRTRTTSIPEESFQRPVEGMSNICGEARRLEDPMQAMDIKIEDEEDASATFESAKTVQQRRRTVPVPEESFHIPMKIPRRSSDTEITQNEPTPVSQSSLSSNPSSSAGSSVHIEGIIRLPEFLMGHGSYHDFWKKPWVVRALKAVSDREMTLRNCSDLLGVGYDVLYSRYRRVHGCLKEGSVDSPGPSQDNAFRFLRTVGDQEGNIIVSKDQPPPTTAALPAVSHSERPADTSEIEDTLEPIVNVKMEPSISLSDQFESEIMKDNVDVHNMDKCVEITNFFFCADNP